MKTLLVLCTLVAAVYCNTNEIVFRDNCIGINHSSQSKETVNDDDVVENTGIWEIAQICCDQPFDTNTVIEGFKEDMESSNILQLLDQNFDILTEGKTNCALSDQQIV